MNIQSIFSTRQISRESSMIFMNHLIWIKRSLALTSVIPNNHRNVPIWLVLHLHLESYPVRTERLIFIVGLAITLKAG